MSWLQRSARTIFLARAKGASQDAHDSSEVAGCGSSRRRTAAGFHRTAREGWRSGRRLFEQSSRCSGPHCRKIVGPSRLKVPRVVSTSRSNPARRTAALAQRVKRELRLGARRKTGNEVAMQDEEVLASGSRRDMRCQRFVSVGQALSAEGRRGSSRERCEAQAPRIERHPPVGPKLPRRKTPRHRTRGVPQRELPGPTCEANHQRRCRAAPQTPLREARLDRKVDQTER